MTAPDPHAAPYEELARQIGLTGAVRRELARSLPDECPPASAAVLTLLSRHGEMRMSRLTDLLGIDMSVTSRQVAYAVDRGWIDRRPDPLDGRVRLLRLTEDGLLLLRETHRRATDVLAEVLADWPEEDVGRLTELLARLHESFGDCGRRGARGAHRTASLPEVHSEARVPGSRP
ncbi:MarR family winged helix-turn-helix transcriptional regulator [Streptomyces sp. TRM 70361]|uniref:MarR family winged helix-turn-helix transcriptional regulator n=1 Tax=Streptomyces sp. TRM 70361 TaxID=3116553 RepID=UPI002E7C5648|nr:MarR family winged helix-turn-helix transcriptional regulator [Streptomyces sp. TRM 70361]MEE1939672.1 MarR family winged helix-turn-helix transcriptional regulator [Streptomyces sp. TRM 70361]